MRRRADQPATHSWSRFIGIDFSGGRDAGRKIWIAEAEAAREGICITRVERADRMLGVSARREHVLPALVEYVAGQGEALIGMDFPFSLPECALFVRPWREFALRLGERFADADEMRAWCWERAGGHELRRETERVAATPFCSYNLWIKLQTYYGISQVIAPLLRAGAAVFAPMQPVPPQPVSPVVVEVCPASTLKSLGIPADKYKGRSADCKARRAEVLASLQDAGLLTGLPPDAADTAITDHEGDALDAITAAIAASRPAAHLLSSTAPWAGHEDEGRVFF